MSLPFNAFFFKLYNGLLVLRVASVLADVVAVWPLGQVLLLPCITLVVVRRTSRRRRALLAALLQCLLPVELFVIHILQLLKYFLTGN